MSNEATREGSRCVPVTVRLPAVYDSRGSEIYPAKDVQPEGWMFVLAFALAGIPWAVEKALDPEFDMDGKVRKSRLMSQRRELEDVISRTKARLREYESQLGLRRKEASE